MCLELLGSRAESIININIVCGQLQLPKSIDEETTGVNRGQRMIIN